MTVSFPSTREDDAGAEVTAQGATIVLRGAWTTRHLGHLALQIDALLADSARGGYAPDIDAPRIDASSHTAFDTGGAWVLHGLGVQYRY